MEVDGNLDTHENEISRKRSRDADAAINGAVRLPGALGRAKLKLCHLFFNLLWTRRVLPTGGVIFRSSWGFKRVLFRSVSSPERPDKPNQGTRGRRGQEGGGHLPRVEEYEGVRVRRGAQEG